MKYSFKTFPKTSFFHSTPFSPLSPHFHLLPIGTNFTLKYLYYDRILPKSDIEGKDELLMMDEKHFLSQLGGKHRCYTGISLGKVGIILLLINK